MGTGITEISGLRINYSWCLKVSVLGLLTLLVLLSASAGMAQCSGNVYDTGGSSTNYSNNENYSITYTAPAGEVMILTFNVFDLESGYDFLKIYDGPNTSSPLLANLTGSTLPSAYTSTDRDITIQFTSDNSVNRAGWDITLSCSMVCFAVAESDNGRLYSWSGNTNTYVGLINRTSIEAIAMNYDGTIIYGTDAGIFGTINKSSAAWTTIATIGSGDGTAGTVTMSDVDGLAINPTNGLIMGVHRRNSDWDLLIAINPITGKLEKNYFGEGIDYREITGAYLDIDDIAFHPASGALYGVSTVSGSTTNDHIVLIDEYIGTATSVSVLPTCDIEGLTFANDGTMYGSSGFEECTPYASNSVFSINYLTDPGTVTFKSTLGHNDAEALACYVAAVQPCITIDEPGQIISTDQTLCSGIDAAPLTNVSSASYSGGGTIEYQWYYSTTTCLSPLNQDPNWIALTGETGLTYDPGILSESTCFVRGAKLDGCPNYTKFSNVIRIEIEYCPCTLFDTLTVSISMSSDDAEEASNGSMNLTSTDLEMVEESSTQTVGLRFNNINIPRNSYIKSAYLNFEADESDSDPTSLIIHGERSANASTFSTSNNNITNRDTTFISVKWDDIENWTTGSFYSSITIKEVIEEIVSQNGWSSGNSLALIISGQGSRVAESFNGNGAPVELVIEFCQAEICDNSLDDDGDGDIDCADLECGDIDNSQFNNGTIDWLLNVVSGNSATLTPDHTSQLTGSNSARIDIATTLGVASDIQMIQSGKNLVAGNLYEVHFDAKAASPRTIEAMVQLSVSPNTIHWNQSVNLTTSKNSFFFEFVAPVTSTGDINFMFNLGASSETVWIDNVQFKESCCRPESLTGPATLCPGETTSLSPTSGGTWSSSNAAVATVTNAGVVTGVGAGSATFTFNDATTGCIRTTAFNVTVYAAPTLNAGADITVCDGETINLNATGSGSGSLGYSWDQGLGAGASHSFTANGNNSNNTSTTYSVTLTDDNCTETDYLTATILSLPSPTVSHTDETCEQDNGSINFTFSNHSNRTHIQFSIDGGTNWNSVADASGSYTFNNLTPATYDLKTKWDNNDCEVDLADVTIIEENRPVVTITGATTICVSDTTTLTPNTGGTWSTSNPFVATIDNAGVATGVTAGNVVFTFTDGITGCPSLASNVITVIDTTVVSITGPSSFCEGGTTTLSPTSGGTWMSSDTSVATVTNGGIVTSVGSGTVSFIFTNNSTGCTSETPLVTVFPEIIPSINGSDVSCLEFGSVIYATGGSTYLWSTGETNDTIEIYPAVNTTYFVTVTGINGCTAVASKAIVPQNCYNTICFNGNNNVGATVNYSFDFSENPVDDKMTIRVTLSKNFVDNTFGVNRIGWPAGHSFGDLVESDNLSISLYDANNNKQIDATLDYISPSATAPSGYENDGVIVMNQGNVSDILDVRSSLEVNLNDYGYVLTTDSPVTDNNYTVNPAYPNWIYEVWFEIDVKLSAFGTAGFGKVEIPTLHASPSKSSSNSESVEEGDCCLMMVGITGDSIICEGESTQLTADFTTSRTVEIFASGDTYIAQDNPTKHYGKCKEMFVESTTSSLKRALLKFDISQIPSGATIVSAKLKSSKKSGSNNGIDIGVYRTTATWEEQGNVGSGCGKNDAASWNERIPGTNWTNSGGDFNAIPESTIPVSTNAEYEWDVTNLIEGWKNGSFANEGLLLKAASEGISDQKVFHSTNYQNFFFRPKIIVEYTIPLTISEVVINWSNGDSTDIITVAPTSSTLYAVTVSELGACVGESTLNIEVGAISVNITGNTNICVGETTTLSPTSGGVWTSSDDAIATVSNDGTVTGISSGSVNFEFTKTSDGCSRTTSNLTVNAVPIVSVTGATTLCTGETTNLSPSSGGTWTSNNPSVATVSNSGVVTAIAEGTAKFQFTHTTTGCISLETEVVTINTTPTSSLTGDSEICTGETTTLIPTTGGTWSSSDTGIATVSNAGIVTGVGAGNATFTFTSSEGCNALPTNIVTVNAKPVVNIIGPSSICDGSTTLLSPSAGGIWISNNPAVATVSNSGIVTSVSPGTATFTFTSGSNGCVSEPTLPVTVNPALSASIAFLGTICLEDNSQLTANITGGTPNFTYSWTGPNGFTSSLDTVTIIDDGNYYVTVTDAVGCQTATSAFVYERYEPFIFTLNTEICEGEDVSLTVSSGTAIAYAWGANAGNATTSAVLVTPSPPSTTYTVTVTNDIGCTTEASVTIDVITKPVVTISGPSTICLDETTTLSPSTGGTWTSTNTSVAVVSNSGLVTSIGPGTANFVFTDTTTYCDSQPTTSVTVLAKPTVSVSGPNTICEDETTTLSPTSGGTWSSSNPSIATVTNNGIVTGVGYGTATFIFTDTTTTCVSDPTTSITIVAKPVPSFTGSDTICVNATTNISPSIGGTWISSDPSVATITNSGSITGIGPGTATFVFTNTSTGCISDASAELTVRQNETITLTGNNQVCQGDSTQLTPSVTGGLWSSSNPLVATVSSTGMVVALEAGNAIISYDHNSTGCYINPSFAIVVDSKPIVSVIGAMSICTGSTTLLTPNSGGTWVSSNPTVATVTNGGLVTGLSNGTANFIFTNTNTGCVSDATASVTVYPEIEVTIDYIGSICLVDTTQLSAVPIGGTPGFTYNWTGPGGFSSTLDTIDVILNGNYYLTVTDNVGCSATTSAFVYEQYDPFVFTLNTEVCEGDDITLSVNSATAVNFQWGPNAGNATSQSVTVTPVGPSTTYNVTVINDIGCSTTASAIIDVNAKPVANITGANDICAGETTTLSPTTGGTWSSSNNAIATVNNSGVVTGVSTGSVTFTFTDDINSCSSDPTLNVSVTDNATIVISGDNSICMGDSSILSASVAGGNWISSNPSVATVNASGVVHPISQGSIMITYDPNSPECYFDANYAIDIYNNPNVNITGPTTICENETTSLSPSSGGIWESSDTLIATISAGGLVTGKSGGNVFFTFTSSATGCASTTITPITVVGDIPVSLNGPSEICVGTTTSILPTSGGLWFSSNSSVATVNSSGIVTGKASGIATFTFIESTNGCLSQNTITVTVHDNPTVNLIGPDELCVTEITSISPSTGGTWGSSNDAIATISNGGIITALTAGVATFQYTSNVTGCVSEASVPVTVNGKPTTNFIGPDSLCQGETTSISPTSGGTWISTDVSVATINNSGAISAVSAGSARFVYTNSATGCKSDTSTAVIVNPPAIISITGDSRICVGETTTLSPSTGGTWQSSNPVIATVTNTGIVNGVSPGIVTFTFNSSASCTSNNSLPITVDPKPNPAFSGPSSICIGSTTNLTPTSGGLWTSSNSSIATITNSGIVTAISNGTANFTFQDTTTGCFATTSTALTVFSKPLTSISGANQICVGATTSLSPSSGGIWTSSNDNIATISSNGTVTGISAGVVTFIFTESGSTCSSDPSAPVTILAKPIISITGNNQICEDETTTMSPSAGGIWISSNPAVATINNAGIVTGVSQGIVRFTFISDAGCASNQSSPITVFGKPEIIINGSSSLCIDETLNLSPTSGGTWTSSDTLIATITNSGVVTAIAAGDVTFIFSDSNTGCISDPSQTITVMASPDAGVLGSTQICTGTTTNLTPTTGGIWTSSDPSVATVENNGTVNGIAPGTVYFTFTELASGCTSDATSMVTVISIDQPIYLFGSTICVGETTSLFPSSGVTWQSTNPSVATIDNNGLVTAVSQGTAKFFYTVGSGGCTSTFSSPLTVDGNPNVSLNGPSTICIGNTTNLFPSSGGTWASNNPSVASINNNGLITGISAGTSTFVFTDNETGCSSNGAISVTISESPTTAITGDTTICIGYTTTLSPTSGGIWTSSNPSIASVSNDGVVTGKAPGKVTFFFLDSSTGCNSDSNMDSIIIEPCLNHDFNVTTRNNLVAGNLNTNDNVPSGSIYNSTPILVSKPNSSIPVLTILSDGSYTFSANISGKYIYNVPICIPPQNNSCPKTILEITVLGDIIGSSNPVSNLEFSTTYTGPDIITPGQSVVIKSLGNDRCVKTEACQLDGLTTSIYTAPKNGSTSINALGDITYTPNAGFIGMDTLKYSVCIDAEPTNCSVGTQVITVNDLTAINKVVAADDFSFTMKEIAVSGNVLANDIDPESDPLQVTSRGSLLAPISIIGGAYFIDNLGNYTFTPDVGFVGSTEIIYTVCDDQSNCTDATLHLLVFDDLTLQIRVYLEGALMNNGGATSSQGRPLMRDDLRSSPYSGKNYLPTIDPFANAIGLIDITNNYDHLGPGLLPENGIIVDTAQVFGVTGQNAIVDWIYVELRSKIDMTQNIAARAGLLQRDGDIVDLDGVSPLRFKGVNQDSFYVLVKHRSHLGAMTLMQSNMDVIDFTSPQTPIFNFGTDLNNGVDYTGLSQKTGVVSGYNALWAGDFDSDGKVKFTNPSDDQNILFFEVLLFPNNTSSAANFDFGYGFVLGDYNMNSKGKYTNPDDDKNLLFSQVLLYPQNTLFLSNFDYFIEQIPE